MLRERAVVGRDAEHGVRGRGVADQHARLPDERLDERPRIAAAPQGLAIVEIEAHGNAAVARAGHRRGERGGGPVAQRRSDARGVKPLGLGEDRGPIERPRIDVRERRARAVVDDAHRAQIGSRLGEIDPQPLAPAEDPRGADALALERGDAPLADGVLGDPRDVLAAHTQVAQTDGDVRLGAAEERHEPARLEQFLFSRR